MPFPEYPNNQDSDTIILDSPDKATTADHTHVAERKRKRDDLMDEKLSIFRSMNEAVNKVEFAITERTLVNVHPSLYSVVINNIGFNEEALMLALSHSSTTGHMVLGLLVW